MTMTVTKLAARLRLAKLRHAGVDTERFPYERCPEQEKLEWEAIAKEVLSIEEEVRKPEEGQSIGFGYTNWRGEDGLRRAIPIGLRWGSTEWHPQDGWLLEAWDEDKDAVRQFALGDCDFTRGGVPSESGGM